MQSEENRHYFLREARHFVLRNLRKVNDINSTAHEVLEYSKNTVPLRNAKEVR